MSKKDFCFWVVPAGDSTSVKKVRISLWQILLLLGITSTVFAVLLTVACDYLRLSGVNGRNAFLLKNTRYQRDSLIGAQDDLKGKISSFLSEQEASESLHEEIENKLEEIENFILTAKAVEQQDHKKILKGQKIARSPAEIGMANAIGGLEKSCQGTECKVYEDDLMAGIGKQPEARAGFNDKASLQLDRLSDALRIMRSIPLLVPVQADISSGFGYRWSPFERGLAVHEGIDFAAPKGTAIGVAGDGVVKEVSRNSTYGLMIDVEHTPRIVTRYAHLSAALVSPGEKLLRGDLIGQIGSTGKSTGPHLHYEIIVDNRQVDPIKYIKLADKLSDLMS